MACTTLLVGKCASFDGSTIIARNEDSGAGEFTEKKMAVVPARKDPAPYKSVISHLELELPGGAMRYSSVPDALGKDGIWAAAGVNELDVAMTATETLTTNPRVLAADPLVEYVAAKDGEPERVGGIGEEDMVSLVLPYAQSARDGVLRLGALLEKYGTYEMNGIAFSDLDEIWWLETVGGHHWIAARVPDDEFVIMPNQLGLDVFDLDDAFSDDPQNYLCSADLREFIADNHLDLSLDEDELFNPRLAFGSHSDADHVYNTPRAWDIIRRLCPEALYENIYAPEDDTLPWSLIPERKLTIEDVKDALSLHFQGTVYDPYGKLGTEAEHHLYRPIGVNRNCQLAILQLRPYAPKAARALQWMSFGSNVFNTTVPLFANVSKFPEYLENTGALPSTENFYWANRIIAALADAQFSQNLIHIERYQEKTVSLGLAEVLRCDKVLGDVERKDAQEALGEVNERICKMLKEQTDLLLKNVLYTTSMNMKNAFARSDG